MSSQDDDNQGVVLGVVFGLIVLVVALVLGVGIYKERAMSGGAKKATSGQAAMAPDANAAAQAGLAAGASVKVVDGVVKFYFASGKSDLAAGGAEALATIVSSVAAGKKAVISGFHDATGDPAKNAELAKVRAFQVRDTLKALGVAEDKIELKKPEQALATGPDAEARRVEVSIQ